jgi:response regulator RpfG family c-di-GMP phosphodiesterase
MNDKILIVDDEENILSSIRRQLRGKYDLTTAVSGKAALKILDTSQKFSVVLSDYKMPEMNGGQLLAEVKARTPDTVRMMLTGQADMKAVINVINEGNIFRFLTKPCPPELLTKNIDEGIKQYKLIHAEKELLSKTLGGTIQVMTDLLVLTKPQAFNRSLRVKEMAKKMLSHMKIEGAWQIEIAAMLSQIGCVTVPDSILNKVYKNLNLPHEDRVIYQLHTQTSSDIISKIPRMEHVSKIIAYQEKYYNGTGFPNDGVKGKDIPLGSRMLRIAMDYDNLLQSNTSSENALNVIKERKGWYDENLLEVFEKSLKITENRKKFSMMDISLKELSEEMFLSEEIVTASGVILGGKNQKVTKTLIVTLQNYHKNGEIINKVSVLKYENE